MMVNLFAEAQKESCILAFLIWLGNFIHKRMKRFGKIHNDKWMDISHVDSFFLPDYKYY